MSHPVQQTATPGLLHVGEILGGGGGKEAEALFSPHIRDSPSICQSVPELEGCQIALPTLAWEISGDGGG